MAIVYKCLGQSNPSATTLTTLYTVPASTSAVGSSIVICNQGAASATFRVSVRVAGAADTTKQYLFYDVTLAGNSSTVATLGMTLAATDIVSVYASTATMSFSIFGSEHT